MEKLRLPKLISKYLSSLQQEKGGKKGRGKNDRKSAL